MKPSEGVEGRYLIARGFFYLDLQDRSLFRNGEPVPLGGKAFELLRALMEAPGKEFVTKNELVDMVWQGRPVSDSVLTTAVKEIRKALGDDARSPAIVETVHGRGYRFLLDVERSDRLPADAIQRPAPTARFNYALLAIGALILLAGAAIFWVTSRAPPVPQAPADSPHPQSIAVLPFQDLSQAKDKGWFAVGLTQEVISGLARTPDLRVAARSSVPDSTKKDPAAIGRELRVANVLTASIRYDVNRVRVTAQLIQTSDGTSIWSQNFDRSGQAVIGIQEEIAAGIARALNTVTRPERLGRMVSAGTRSVEAYEEYLSGLAYEKKSRSTGDPQDEEAAIDAFERAARFDPMFATAYWRAAEHWGPRNLWVNIHEDVPDAVRKAKHLRLLDLAIQASGDDVESLKYRANRAKYNLRHREALRLMLAYAKERPRSYEAWTDAGIFAGAVGNWDLVGSTADKLHVLGMESGAPRSYAVLIAANSGNAGQAIRMAQEQLRLQPEATVTLYNYHGALLWAGRRSEAKAILEQLRKAPGIPKSYLQNAELRQACADNDLKSAIAIERQQDVAATPLGLRWQGALTLGDRRRAIALLKRLDRADQLTDLATFLGFRYFDVRDFPMLDHALRAEGVNRPAPVPIPYACKIGNLAGAAAATLG